MNTAEELYSFGSIWRQYLLCRANKRNTLNALAFEADAEANVLDLQAELRAHSYRPGTSICFVSRGPKPREVFAADFRDRVVHHLLISRQEPHFDRRFIHDSFACRKGKGTLAASDRLGDHLRSITRNGTRKAWALRLDVASFFPSIDKRILYDILSGSMRDPELLWLTRVILFHDPTADFRFRSLDGRMPPPGAPGYPVPLRKSLFGKGGRKGMPIGNLTSQFWANVYMDRLDQFVKHDLRCRHYVRYVDDMVLLSTDRDRLVDWRQEIETFLRGRLALELRPGVDELRPVARGVEFVGWRTWWSHRVPRRQTIGALERVVDRFERRSTKPVFEDGGLSVALDGLRAPRRADGRYRATTAKPAVADLRDSLASYAGHLQHGDAGREWARLWEARPWLWWLFTRAGWKIRLRWPLVMTQPPSIAAARSVRYGDRYRATIRGAGEDCLVFFPAGRFIEFHGPQRALAERHLELRRARIGRGDYAWTAGFPAVFWPAFARMALKSGAGVCRITPSGRELLAPQAHRGEAGPQRRSRAAPAQQHPPRA